jgi:hypothetical protein
MKALLLALTCLALFAVACGGSDSASDGGASVGSTNQSSGPAAPDTAAPNTSAAAIDAKLVVTSTLELHAKSLRDSFDAIARLAREAGGFTAEARLSDSGDESSTASMRLRVPAARHDDFVTAVRAIEGVETKREESNAKEVTAEYTDLESRLINLQRTEAQYQQILTRAASIDEVLKITPKLDATRGEIEQVQGRIKLLEDQSAYATVNVRLALPPVVATTEESQGLPSPLKVFVEAMDTSLVVAHAVANALVVLLVAGLWLLPAGAIGLLAWRRFRRQIEAFGKWIG